MSTFTTQPSALSFDAISAYGSQVGEHHGVYDHNGRANVEELVARLGGRVEYRDSRESLHVDGHSSFAIYLSTQTSGRRDRFTLAHELGHYFLHYLHPERHGAASFSRGATNLSETQANIFASSLLMPKAQFTRAYHELAGDQWKLAERFGVSPRAAEVRAQVLGLVRR